MDYTLLAPDSTQQRTADNLVARNVQVIRVKNGAEALETLKTLIPAGASVMNGSSRTLEEIGFVEHLKGGSHGWNNLHAAIVAEKDAAKQGALRKQALLADYYLGSVHALAQTGEFIIASNTGSQLPHIVYSSQNLVLVVGAQKIVPTLADAMKRLEEHVVPLENENSKAKWGVPTQLNKIFTFRGENTMSGRTVRVILVDEKLGF